MLTASRPPNAPDTVAAEKNIANLIPNSLRLYQLSSPNRTVRKEKDVVFQSNTMEGEHAP